MKLNFPPSYRIELLVGLLVTGLIAVGLLIYAIQEPARIVQAQEAQLAADLDEAMTLYAENCAVCHGLSGEGIGATLPLDNPNLKPTDPIALAKIIARGLYGTAMPAWSKEDGGPLSDYQIDQLTLLIQQGDWHETQNRVVNLGLAPQIPFSAVADPAILETVKALPDGEELSQGITLYAEQCVACHGADGTGTPLAPALNDPAVRVKPAEEIERTVLNGVPATLMASWKNKLTDQNLAAVIALITRWDEVPAGAIPAPDHPVPVTEESLAMGTELYAQNCSRCHGPEGQGTQRAPSLNVKSYLGKTSDSALQQIITLGVSGTAMPAWGDRMTDAQIQAIVGFIRSWEPTAPEVATPTRGGGPWWATGGTRPGGRSNSQSLPSGGQPSAGQSQTGQLGSTGQQQGGGQAQGQASGQQQGGGPPWARQQTQTSWLQTLDWRSTILVATVILLSMAFIIIAFYGLRRLKRAGAEQVF
jgi:mono/diheme cytochrome c family protein